MNEHAPEQRGNTRTELVRPCRLLDPRTGKFLHGTTCDLSLDGVLIRITRPCGLKPGDTLMVGISMNEKTALLKAKDMFEVRVIRAFGTPSGHTMIACQITETSIPLQSELPRAA